MEKKEDDVPGLERKDLNELTQKDMNELTGMIQSFLDKKGAKVTLTALEFGLASDEIIEAGKKRLVEVKVVKDRCMTCDSN